MRCVVSLNYFTTPVVFLHNKKGQRTVISSFIPFSSFFNCLLFVLNVEAFAEPLDTSGGIKDALLPREEWVAL